MTSQINPNNINGNYPEAGKPNSTEGMRSNFTNTKTNFQYAADEITELQNKSIFKAALTGAVLDNNMNDNLIYAVQLKDVSYSEVQLTTTSGSVVLDYSAAMYQAIPSTTGSVSLDFTNWPVAGTVGVLRFAIVISNIAHTLTLPTSVSIGVSHLQGWNPSTRTITFPSTGTYIYEFLTSNGGATISIQDIVQPAGEYLNAVVVANTTPSTSTTTGCAVFAGGIGVAGNVYAGRFYGDGSYLSNIYPNYLFNGTSYVGIGASGGNANISIGGTANVVVVSNTQVQISASGGLALTDGGTMGYTNGAGGTVSQTGNKSTAVTLNKPSGEITMQATSLNANTSVSFTLNNTTIGARDVLILNIVGGVATPGTYNLDANCTTGSATITVRNITAGSLSEAVVLRYVVIKGSIA